MAGRTGLWYNRVSGAKPGRRGSFAFSDFDREKPPACRGAGRAADFSPPIVDGARANAFVFIRVIRENLFQTEVSAQ